MSGFFSPLSSAGPSSPSPSGTLSPVDKEVGAVSCFSLLRSSDNGGPNSFRSSLQAFRMSTYSDSMEKLKSDYDAPEGSPYSGYGIRDMENWEGVRDQLLKAKEVYAPTTKAEGNEAEDQKSKTKRNSGLHRFFKRTRRQTTASSEQIKTIRTIVGQFEVISPVLGVIDVLLDVRTSSFTPSIPLLSLS